MDPDQWLAGIPQAGSGSSSVSLGATAFTSDDPPVFWAPHIGDVLDRSRTDKPPASIATPGGPRPNLLNLPGVVQPPASIAKPKPTTSKESREAVRISRSEAVQRFYGWSDEERAKWAQHLVNLGLIDEDEALDYQTIRDLWVEVVDETALLTAAGKKLNPWQVASLLAGGEEGAARRRAAREADKPFTGTRTSTARQVDLTDPKTAKSLINGVLADALGRAANPEELQSFLSVLNAAERANPATQTTNTTYQDGVAVSSSSTTAGGLTNAGRQELLLEKAQALPEYGAVQAATTYYNALLQAVQSPV